MSFIDDAKNWATMPVPGPGIPAETRKRLDGMTATELAGLWCALQYVGLRERSEETWTQERYFDHLPHEAPERALAMVLAALASEAHPRVLMQLNDRFMTALLHRHGERLADRIEAEARGNARLRWLLGGCAWFMAEGLAKTRLSALADKAAWYADKDARDTPAERIDFAALAPADLARVWVEQHAKPRKDQDDNWHALCDFERELNDRNPDAVIDLVLDVLKIEDNDAVLGLLAAGPLENAISMTTIERIEREAAAHDKFRWLLGGVWYSSAPEPLKARLDAIVQDQRW